MDANQNSHGVASTLRRSARVSRWSLLLAVVALLAASPLAGARGDDAAPVATEDSSAGSAASVALAAGKLVICGGGKLPDQLGRRFIELAGGEAARLVVITTASGLADTDRIETKLTFWRRQMVQTLTVLHTRSRERANASGFAEALVDATGVWFIGGNQRLLTDTYLGTATERGIRGVLERGGVVGGTSAGAAIMSPVMIRRDTPEVEEGPGFGFLPGTVVDQHFLKRNRQARLLRVLDRHPELVGLGIDEGTALVVEGARMEVLGDSQVMVCSSTPPDQPAQVRRLDAGAEADLLSLRSEVLAKLASRESEPARSETAEPKPKPAGGDRDAAAVSDSASDVENAGQTSRSAPMSETIGQ